MKKIIGILLLIFLPVLPVNAEVEVNGNVDVPAGTSSTIRRVTIDKPVEKIEIKSNESTIVITPTPIPTDVPQEPKTFTQPVFVPSVTPIEIPTASPTAIPILEQPKQEEKNIFSSFVSFVLIPFEVLFGLFR